VQKINKIMTTKNKKQIQDDLASVGAFLSMQSSLLPGEDSLSWAAECIQSYVEGKEKSLDQAFGLPGAKKEKPELVVPSNKNNDWIATALRLVISKTPTGKEWPTTKDLANIGRFCGLEDKDNDKDDESIASELKNILAEYDSFAIEQLSKKIEITEILNTPKD
tara:strand:+ start:10839 stop:11330 length:492 start_codon:yes stop_codon:yes gene_type:complete